MKFGDRCPLAGDLARFQLGSLSDSDIDEIGRHLEDCLECQLKLAATDPLDSLTEGLKHVEEPTLESGPNDARVIEAVEGWAGRLPHRSSRMHELPRIEGYEVLEVLGRGGMGIVYRARDLKLKRTVALKMMRVDGPADPRVLPRFRIEAEAVARLQHPNIVQIHEVGETEGYPYCALEFIEGVNLAKKLQGGPLPILEAVRLVESLARAMHLAHSRNIVHRDLKPANILFTNDGVPKITDFGLARRMDEDSGETKTGAVMGTPSYMAPEQASGLAHEAGPAADIYAMGAILYECLTGRPPFEATTVAETLEMVRTCSPAEPSRFQREISIDLSMICLTCLRKEPEFRYASAAALADELARFQNGEPIQARPIGRMEWCLKWGKRNPLAAQLMAGLVALSLLAFVLVSWSYFVARSSLQSARENERAERWGRYRSNIAAASAAFQLQNTNAAREALKDAPEEHRGWEWHYFKNQLDGASLVLPLQSQKTRSIVMNPSGRQIAVDFIDHKNIYLFNIESGQLDATLTGHSASTSSLAYRPDGKQLATAADDHTIRLWDTTTGRQLDVWKVDSPSPELEKNVRIEYTADGSRILSSPNPWSKDPQSESDPDKELRHRRSCAIRLWDADSGREIAVLAKPSQLISSTTGILDQSWMDSDSTLMSRDGRRVAMLINNYVDIYETTTGRRLFRMGPHPTALQSSSFSPDGKRIAVTLVYTSDVLKLDSPTRLNANVIQLWNTENGTKLAELRGHTSFVQSIRFSPDGSRLVSTSVYPDNTARLWNVSDGHMIANLFGHKNTVVDAIFSSDGERIVTYSLDQTARLWDGRNGKLQAVMGGHTGQIRSAEASPNGQRLVTASEDATLRLWRVDTGQLISVLRGHSEGFAWHFSTHFSPDGSRLVSGSKDGTIRVWNVGLAERNGILLGHESYVYDAAFSNDGRQAATVAWDGTARLWNTTTGNPTAILRHETSIISALAYSRDGSRLVTSEFARGVNIWNDAATSKPTRDPWSAPLQFEEGSRIALNPANTILATASREGHVRLWDLTTKQELAPLVGHDKQCLDVAFHPDGKLLASSGWDGTVRLWNVETHEQVAIMSGHSKLVWRVAFSKDGKLLASGSNDQTIRLWDVQTHKSLSVIPTGSIVYAVSFSPDGKRLAAGCRDNSVRLFDVASREQVAELHNHSDYVHAVDWSPDGTRLISGSGDFTARIWDSLSVIERSRRSSSK